MHQEFERTLEKSKQRSQDAENDLQDKLKVRSA